MMMMMMMMMKWFQLITSDDVILFNILVTDVIQDVQQSTVCFGRLAGKQLYNNSNIT